MNSDAPQPQTQPSQRSARITVNTAATMAAQPNATARKTRRGMWHWLIRSDGAGGRRLAIGSQGTRQSLDSSLDA
jgi:hypothetical protein